MLNKKFIEAIKIIYQKTYDKDLTWSLIGSCNLALQGIELTPNDLDIITNKQDLKIFERELKKYVIRPIYERESKSQKTHFYYVLELNINGVEVEIIGEGKNNLYYDKVINNGLIQIKIDNFQIPCLNLESELEAYKKMNRLEKVNIIKTFLEKNSR